MQGLPYGAWNPKRSSPNPSLSPCARRCALSPLNHEVTVISMASDYLMDMQAMALASHDRTHRPQGAHLRLAGRAYPSQDALSSRGGPLRWRA